METEPSRTGLPGPWKEFPAILAGVSFFLLLLPPLSTHADIYRWKDSTGTVHFTDDVTTIPPQYRKDSIMMIREAPSVGPPAQAPPSGTTRGEPSEEEKVIIDVPPDEVDPYADVEELKAKIAAKEEHIRAIDARRSLATNPLRNRFVDQKDLDLYKKYQAELPGDRQHLKELESRLETIK
jgi:hypothetical protein